MKRFMVVRAQIAPSSMRKLEALGKRLLNVRELCKNIAADTEYSIDTEQFASGGTPSWPPVGEKYQAWKTGMGYGTQTLIMEGDMARSIRSRVKTQEGEGTIEIYSNISEPATGKHGEPTSAGDTPYPIAHLAGFKIFGRAGVKSYVRQRRWNVITPSLQRDIRKRIVAFLEKVFR